MLKPTFKRICFRLWFSLLFTYYVFNTSYILISKNKEKSITMGLPYTGPVSAVGGTGGAPSSLPCGQWPRPPRRLCWGSRARPVQTCKTSLPLCTPSWAHRVTICSGKAKPAPSSTLHKRRGPELTDTRDDVVVWPPPSSGTCTSGQDL